MRTGRGESTALKGMRVLIVHDWMVAWAGAERCVEQILTVFPQADLCVGIMAQSMRRFNAVAERARETWLGRIPGARNHHRWFLPLEGLAFYSLDTRKYQLVISSSHAFSKMVRSAPGATHLCYCYSPPRYLWDLRTTYQQHATGLQRLAMRAGGGFLRALDRQSSRRVDQFVGISRVVADRIRRAYGRAAAVVYPPVVQKPGHSRRALRERFLLSLGRLVPYKRVDLAIIAANRLHMPLVVAGEGPDRRRLESLAGATVRFVGAVSESEAGSLLDRCAAFLFCAEEDFGIAPIEANAHGAPVVGFGRGALTETMREGVTAEFFSEQSVEAVITALRRALTRDWDVDELSRNAERFGAKRFREEFARQVAIACGLQ